MTCWACAFSATTTSQCYELLGLVHKLWMPIEAGSRTTSPWRSPTATRACTPPSWATTGRSSRSRSAPTQCTRRRRTDCRALAVQERCPEGRGEDEGAFPSSTSSANGRAPPEADWAPRAPPLVISSTRSRRSCSATRSYIFTPRETWWSCPTGPPPSISPITSTPTSGTTAPARRPTGPSSPEGATEEHAGAGGDDLQDGAPPPGLAALREDLQGAFQGQALAGLERARPDLRPQQSWPARRKKPLPPSSTRRSPGRLPASPRRRSEILEGPSGSGRTATS